MPETGADGAESPFLDSFKTLVESDHLTITWGGRIYFDAGFFTKDDDYPSTSEDGSEFRTARLYAKGTLYDTVDFNAEYEFGEDTVFKDVYLGFHNSLGKLQVGHFKQPMGLELLTSSRFITFMERATPIEAFTPSRDDGIMESGQIGDTSNYAFGVFRPTDDFGDSRGDGMYNWTGRLAHAF